MGNPYADWVHARKEAYRTEGIEQCAVGVADSECVSSPSKVTNPKTAKWRLAVNFIARANHLESTAHALERVPSQVRGKPAKFIPIRFVFANKVSRVLKIEGTPVYLDVEGLPDRGLYYLIGARVKTAGGIVQHSLWADKPEDEQKIWSDFLEILSEIENPVLVHYGSFETIFLARMCDRYGKPSEGSRPAQAIESSLNVLSVIYAQVYFPTFSNGLKEIARQLRFQWSDTAASGLQTIALRDKWETCRSVHAKQALLTYNAEDWEALELGKP